MSVYDKREIEPALSPLELKQRDAAFAHAQRRDIRKSENAKVKVHVRCNQPLPDNSICRWDQWLQTRAAFAERDGRRAIARHIAKAHPSQSPALLASRAWVNLADIGG